MSRCGSKCDIIARSRLLLHVYTTLYMSCFVNTPVSNFEVLFTFWWVNCLSQLHDEEIWYFFNLQINLHFPVDGQIAFWPMNEKFGGRNLVQDSSSEDLQYETMSYIHDAVWRWPVVRFPWDLHRLC